LSRLVHAAVGPDYASGPASTKRADEVARLTGELARLEAEEEALIDGMNAAGIPVPHRPEVLARREVETRRREQAENAAADREAREAQLDARHARRGRTGGVAAVRAYFDRRAAERRGP
jgi:hypothetical protein